MRSLGAYLIGFLILVAPLAAAPNEDGLLSWLAIIIGWLPVVALLLFWVWYMRKFSLRRHRELQDRSLVHMERIESQSAEMLESLKRIERLLEDRR